MGRPDFAAGVKNALFTLARGYCYEPSYREPVMKFVDGEPLTNVDVAHICALEPSGARYDPAMSLAERQAFGNLILLCTVHHKVIDRTPTRDRYPASLLREWKKKAEGDLGNRLKALSAVTEQRLENMIGEAVEATREGIDAALDDIATTNQEIAFAIRELVYEAFDRPQLDVDAIELLAHSARMLGGLEENAMTLHSAA
ncbi:hypothetical protein, partial [Protofrankia sp. BMG5.30]|uniref:hypothetical protein n=1 Tax=Protofrankia sp. BMG5.30 TaxID=1834514 RepID=UPI0011154E1E